MVSRTRLQNGLKKTIGYFEALLSLGVDSFARSANANAVDEKVPPLSDAVAGALTQERRALA